MYTICYLYIVYITAEKAAGVLVVMLKKFHCLQMAKYNLPQTSSLSKNKQTNKQPALATEAPPTNTPVKHDVRLVLQC